MDETGLLHAIRQGDIDAVRAAVREDPTLGRIRDEAGVSVVCRAVYLGHDDIAMELARPRDDLDVFEASALGDVARVRELLAAGPELANAYSPDGFHPLGYACFFGRERLFELLLEAQADLEAPARNEMRVRPIHSAVAHSDPDVALDLASRLLDAGASPDVAQQNGFTPLHEAALRGHVELVRVLLRHHAKPTARNAKGQVPADLARENGHGELAALLEAAFDAGGSDHTHLPLAYLRAFVIVLVVAHHVATGYSIVAPAEPASSLTEHLSSIRAISPILDDQRSGLLTLFAAFNDSFLMALLFLLSGLFTWGSLERKGRAAFLRQRVLRLGLPLLAMAAVRPLTYYPTYLAAGGSGGLGGFWAEWSGIGWRGGPLWFLELLLLFDLVVVLAAAPLAGLARALLRTRSAWLARPLRFFVPFACALGLAYVPLTLETGPFFWVQVGPAQIQVNRVLLYAVCFSAGLCLGMAGIARGFLAEGSRLARHWLAWSVAALLCFALSVAVSVGGAGALIGGLAYALSSASLSFAALALFLRFANARSRVLDSAFANSYGIYVVHYGIVGWLLFALLDVPLSAVAKWAILFPAALALSWGATAALRRVPGVARVL